MLHVLLYPTNKPTNTKIHRYGLAQQKRGVVKSIWGKVCQQQEIQKPYAPCLLLRP